MSEPSRRERVLKYAAGMLTETATAVVIFGAAFLLIFLLNLLVG